MKQTNLDATDFPLKNEIVKIRSLPKGKRWEYIWEYYRTTFLVAGLLIFILGTLASFLVNMFIGTFFAKEPVSIAFSLAEDISCEAWIEQCCSAIGYDAETEALQILNAPPHSDTRDDFILKTTVWFSAGQPDIFIVNEDSYQYLLEQEVLADFREAWPEPLLRLAEERMASPCALDISGTVFAENHGLTGQLLYLCMFVGGKGFQRALDIVEYMLTQS